MRYGWTGRRLVVNLTDGASRIEEIPQAYLDEYVGGRGLNSRTLYDYQRPGLDPLGPENPLIFGVGPITGTLIPASGRFTVTAFSPLTVVGNDDPCFGDSNAGGFWGPELKYAGYDQLIVEGAASKPVYLLIRDDRVQVRDAAHLWGKTTWETEEALKDELGDANARVASIGPAGEHLVRFACIMNAHDRANGKCGMGAVMGSKRLKAVAVRGTKGVAVAGRAEVQRVTSEAMKVLAGDFSAQTYARYGTPSLVRAHQAQGRMPTRNYQETQFDQWEHLSAEYLEDHYWRRSKACFGCPLHCGHYFTVDTGPYAGSHGEGPEYVSIGGFGTKVAVGNPEAMLHAHMLCNQLGMDTLNSGSTIAWAMECWQRGVMNLSETEGTVLEWGSEQAIMDLLQRMAVRKDAFADLLAEGAYRASKRWGRGSERWVAHAKGSDPALSDPRTAKAWGLGYATASRGGCHLRALATGETFFTPQQAKEMFGSEDAVKARGVKGKGRLVRWSEDERAVADSLETCKFIVRTSLMWPEWEARFLNAVTGLTWTADDIMQAGERINNMERVINVRQGLMRKDDNLSERFLLDPIPGGPAKGEVLNLAPMLDEYYEARGWEVDTGYPYRQTLERLGMARMADDLAAMGRLGRRQAP
jgi:aldehyde:ferredoxin oxidoreductase